MAETQVQRWSNAIKMKIPQEFDCADSLELAVKTFDYEAKMGLMCAMNILTQNIEQYQWPSDWKEAIKARFLPGWVLKLWPVHYTKIEVSAIYPKAKLPDPVFKVTEHHEPIED